MNFFEGEEEGLYGEGNLLWYSEQEGRWLLFKYDPRNWLICYYILWRDIYNTCKFEFQNTIKYESLFKHLKFFAFKILYKFRNKFRLLVKLEFEIMALICSFLLQDDWRQRVSGCEELKALLSGPISIQALLPHLPDLLSLLEALRNDSSYQVVSASLNVINALIGVLGTSLHNNLPSLLWSIVRHVGDPRLVVRIEGMKVFHNLIKAASPRHLAPLICDYLSHRKSRVREDCINLLIVAFLTYPSPDFDDMLGLGERIARCLLDDKRRVRQASLEAMAILSHNLGPSKAPKLIAFIDKLEVWGRAMYVRYLTIGFPPIFEIIGAAHSSWFYSIKILIQKLGIDSLKN